jgi:hypothetical protein
VSSGQYVSSRKEEYWNAAVSLSGAAVWAAVAMLAGLRRAPFGIIELLFLLAPLVVVPLGLELARTLEDPARVSLRSYGLLRWSQIFATLAVCTAFWVPVGRVAAILSSLWLLQCGVLAALRVREWRSKNWSLLFFSLTLAHVDLVIAAAWLVVSRAGWRPIGFQEPIILLTAVHFHYSGFATAIIAATTLSEWERRKPASQGLRTLVLLIALLPFALAAGFVFSALLRFVAAVALSASVTALAAILLWFAGELGSGPARFYLRAAGCAAMAAFALAGLYAVSEYFGKGWITVPGMANSHGVLNGLGFALLALLGWLTELHASAPQGQRLEGTSQRRVPALEHSVGSAVTARADDRDRVPRVRPSPVPEFVAREFYDR